MWLKPPPPVSLHFLEGQGEFHKQLQQRMRRGREGGIEGGSERGRRDWEREREKETLPGPAAGAGWEMIWSRGKSSLAPWYPEDVAPGLPDKSEGRSSKCTG